MRVLFVCDEKHGEELDVSLPLPRVLRFIRPGVRAGFIGPLDKVEYELRYLIDVDRNVTPIYCKPEVSEVDVLDAMRVRNEQR